ncbi:MAG: peptidylprolyl isomerase [Planctomycetota bacterium]
MSKQSGDLRTFLTQYRLVSLFKLALVVALCLAAKSAWSQSDPKPDSAEAVARVGVKEIRDPRVEAYLRATVPGWPLKTELQSPLRRAAVEHLVRRELVYLWLANNGFAATEAEIDWRIDERRSELARVEKKLTDYLAEQQLSLAELQAEFGWELAWKKYLDATLTEEKLAKRFRASPRDFDGTELHVAQILFAVTAERDRDQAIQLAEKIRQQLQRGELTWEAAVREHSIAASRELGGDLGWIRRREPMPEDFTQPTFKLSEGELAPPFATRYGVHLVKCLEVRPGKRQLGDVRELVRRDLMESEYLRLAELMRGEAQVWVRPEK